MSHEQIDDEVGRAVDNEEPVHEAGAMESEKLIANVSLVFSPCQTEKPGGGGFVSTFEDELGQDKFGTVQNKPGLRK